MNTTTTTVSTLDPAMLADVMSGPVAALLIIPLILVILGIALYFLAIGAMVSNAKEKRSSHSSVKLWLIGIFLSPIVLGLIVASCPDRAGSHRA